jgi:hypothetical protein
MFTDVDWSHRATHMYDRHGVTTAQANEALEDPDRVVIDPDYNSVSGGGVRIIGFSPLAMDVLTVIVVEEDGVEYGASAWPSNNKDRNIYSGKGGNDEQDF